MQGSGSVARSTTGGEVSTVDAAAIEAAGKRLDGVAVRTPLERNLRLSERTGAQVWLKREDLQIGRSYKLRGAYNLIAQLDDAAKAAGVICASAGNHGQGLAYSCRGRHRARNGTGSRRSAASRSR
jgi:threonine dehydratase